VPGGWSYVHDVAGHFHKFQVFDTSLIPRFPYLDLSKPYTLLAGIIGGAFFVTASHGTDQLIVQRLLAARNQRQSVLALISSGLAILFLMALFLMVGVTLFAYYGVPSAAFGKADRIYPTFIVTHMPRGTAGLLIAAILAAAMSNLSAALNSLSSSSMMDLYLRFRPNLEEDRRLKLSRFATVAWAIVLFVLAVIALHRVGRVIEVGLQIASIAYGAMLGVFMLGVLTKRAHQLGAIIGMICGFGMELYLWLGTHVAWTWWVPIGTTVTFAVGYAASMVWKVESKA